MLNLRTRSIPCGDVTLRIHEQGVGLAVVLCHGFPGLGSSYRHQMEPLALSGYRAIAVDMPGYGGSTAPEPITAYTYARVTEYLVRLLDALGVEKAVFVGHDFGAPSVWNVALRAPERVAGLCLLSVPYDPDRSKQRPTELYRSMAQRHFLHIDYFQAPGVAERELDPRPREFLARLFHALSGAYRYLDIWKHPSGKGYLDVLPEAPPLPWSWLTEAELDAHAAEFARTGFRGGLSWYRAFDANWEEGDAFTGRTLDVPTLFIAGERDAVIAMRGKAAIDRMQAFVPDLRGVHVLPGIGHWVMQEAAEKVNSLLIDFLRGV